MQSPGRGGPWTLPQGPVLSRLPAPPPPWLPGSHLPPEHPKMGWGSRPCKVASPLPQATCSLAPRSGRARPPGHKHEAEPGGGHGGLTAQASALPSGSPCGFIRVGTGAGLGPGETPHGKPRLSLSPAGEAPWPWRALPGERKEGKKQPPQPGLVLALRGPGARMAQGPQAVGGSVLVPGDPSGWLCEW